MKRAWMLAVAAMMATVCLSPAATQQKPEGILQMEKLNLLVGSWSYTETYAKGTGGTGTYTAQPGPGGYSLIIDFTTHMSGHDEIGHAILTWDPKEMAYKEYVAGNGFPGCAIFTGNWEGDTLTFHGEFEASGGKMALKTQYTEWTPKSITIQEYYRVGDAPFQMLQTTKATKP